MEGRERSERKRGKYIKKMEKAKSMAERRGKEGGGSK